MVTGAAPVAGFVEFVMVIVSSMEEVVLRTVNLRGEER
jgi:hypothetical protein